MARNTLSRSLHDLGLSAWFGGTLANAVAPSAAAVSAVFATTIEPTPCCAATRPELPAS